MRKSGKKVITLGKLHPFSSLLPRYSALHLLSYDLFQGTWDSTLLWRYRLGRGKEEEIELRSERKQISSVFNWGRWFKVDFHYTHHISSWIKCELDTNFGESFEHCQRGDRGKKQVSWHQFSCIESWNWSNSACIDEKEYGKSNECGVLPFSVDINGNNHHQDRDEWDEHWNNNKWTATKTINQKDWNESKWKTKKSGGEWEPRGLRIGEVGESVEDECTVSTKGAGASEHVRNLDHDSNPSTVSYESGGLILGAPWHEHDFHSCMAGFDSTL